YGNEFLFAIQNRELLTIPLKCLLKITNFNHLPVPHTSHRYAPAPATGAGHVFWLHSTDTYIAVPCKTFLHAGKNKKYSPGLQRCPGIGPVAGFS
ncbi:MAG TPA: hypothetical protein VGM41_20135, partial [Chitinophagaceae bacterium]